MPAQTTSAVMQQLTENAAVTSTQSTTLLPSESLPVSASVSTLCSSVTAFTLLDGTYRLILGMSEIFLALYHTENTLASNKLTKDTFLLLGLWDMFVASPEVYFGIQASQTGSATFAFQGLALTKALDCLGYVINITSNERPATNSANILLKSIESIGWGLLSFDQQPAGLIFLTAALSYKFDNNVKQKANRAVSYLKNLFSGPFYESKGQQRTAAEESGLSRTTSLHDLRMAM